MSNSISIITPTRNRPQSFALLERWVKRQDMPYFQWIVVNDGKEKYNYTCGQKVIEHEPIDDLHSLCGNLVVGLDYVVNDWVCIMEDDDHYKSNFLAKMMSMFYAGNLVGLSYNTYYHLYQQRCKNLLNSDISCLASTAFHSSLIPLVKELCWRNNPSIDCELWYEYQGMKFLSDNRKGYWHLGMKGMLGEPGISQQYHRGNFGGFDSGFTTLREMMGEVDARTYERLAHEHKARVPVKA